MKTTECDLCNNVFHNEEDIIEVKYPTSKHPDPSGHGYEWDWKYVNH